ncbi:MAG: CoA transferase [Candidatus Velthaea sp.]
MTAENPSVLAGITVIDMSTILAAPLAASLLGDFGAHVIKIEHPETGDPVRAYPPQKHGVSLQNKVVNRNKRSVAADLNTPEGRDIVRRLVPSADIVVTNFRLETLQKWQLDYDDLRALNESLIVLHVTGFGRTGPYKNRPGFARVAEAFSGLAYMTGFPDRPPLFAGYPIADGIGGIFGAYSILLALVHRMNTGKGQLVEFGLYEPILKLMEGLVVGYDQAGRIPERAGTHNREVAPNDVYQCSDGEWVVLPASTQRMFERLCEAMGSPELALDPRFRTNLDRVGHRAELDEYVRAYFGVRTAAQAAEHLQALGVACTTVNSVRDVIGDVHVRERGGLIRVHDTELDADVLLQNVLPIMSESPGSIRHLGEALGTSTQDVLAELAQTATEQ